ncbi:MAG: hypothetical protein H6613_08775 [Ignavibacteriales bacterium]|nr:hypothetical protein [Ignavibacteriales bacterium]
MSSSISETMNWSKQNSAEQIGNLTAASLEILVELISKENFRTKLGRENEIIHALNTILKQPLMNRNVETVFVIVRQNNSFIALDDGRSVFNYFDNIDVAKTLNNEEYQSVLDEYSKIHAKMTSTELTTSIVKNSGLFYVFVPLVPHGEYSGAVFLKFDQTLHL